MVVNELVCVAHGCLGHTETKGVVGLLVLKPVFGHIKKTCVNQATGMG